MTRAAKGLTRRQFVEVSSAAGAGLLIGFSFSGCSIAPDIPPGLEPGDLNAWIRIGSDDVVTLFVSESEMGQGIMTSLPMILAEELDADWTKVRAEHAPADLQRYGTQGTGGSWSIRGGYETLRHAGAAARELLVSAAAETWDVAASQCGTDNGTVVHSGSGRRLSYGQLAERAARLDPPSRPRLKDPASFRLIGQPIKRLDAAAKVNGSAMFGSDVRLPNMAIAQVTHPPTFGGSVRSFDATEALRVPGVLDIIEIPTGVAVVADNFWAAKKSRDVLHVEWDHGDHGDLSNEQIAEECRSILDRGATARQEGNADRALDRAMTRIEAEYEAPYLAHATMEPMNCTADVRDDRCEIWVGTQAQTSSQRAAAQITGLPLDAITLHTMFLGGGFGRRSQTDFVKDAVLVSKAVGRPVKVLWTREDDMRAGWYRPISYHKMEGGVDAAGRPVAWTHRMATPGILESTGRSNGDYDTSSTEGAEDLPYRIQNLRLTCAHPDFPIPVHWWRSVGHSQNAYVTECFFDELARAGGRDPLELRLELLGDHPRHHRLLELLAEKARWGSTPPEGRARGVALHASFGSIVAQIAEVSRQDSGDIRVHRVWCAVDCGQVINPDTIVAQMESGIAFGLSAALYGKLDIEQGRVVQGNYDLYPVIRMNEMPAVETYVAPSGDAVGGIGETGLPPIAPAVCNALLALTGTPTRKLPISRG